MPLNALTLYFFGFLFSIRFHYNPIVGATTKPEAHLTNVATFATIIIAEVSCTSIVGVVIVVVGIVVTNATSAIDTTDLANVVVATGARCTTIEIRIRCINTVGGVIGVTSATILYDF